MTWISDDGSIIRHNTFADGACDFGQRCGVINVGAVDSTRPAAATDHPRQRARRHQQRRHGGQAAFVAQHNLSADPITGSGNLTGLPRYAAPATATTGTAWPGSLGAGDAPDGSDLGIERGGGKWERDAREQ